MLVFLVGLLLAVNWLFLSQKRASTELVSQLAATNLENAKAKLDQGRPDEALAVTAATMKLAPELADAHELASKILVGTEWHLPVLTLQHPLSIDRIDFAEPSSLWVGLAGDFHTVVRWNLDAMRIENVLFPLPRKEVRSLVFDPLHSRMLVERAGLLLLCDAQSLKPIREIGELPDFVTPSATIVFSADGLLLAHPAMDTGEGASWAWQVRDAVSGNLIRSENAGADAPRPLAAFLDRRSLRALHADGSTLEIPVSPLESIRHTPASEKMLLHHAQFSTDGKSALAQIDQGPHQEPELEFLSETGHDGSLKTEALLTRFSWNRHPGIWSGLLREAQLEVTENQLKWLGATQAAVLAPAPISAVALGKKHLIVGNKNGELVIHQRFPRLTEKTPAGPKKVSPEAVRAFETIASALSGLRHDEGRQSLVQVTAEERLLALKNADFEVLAGLFPELNFSVLEEFDPTISLQSPEPEAMKPLLDRLARMKPDQPEGAPSQATALAKALASSEPPAIEQRLAAAENLPPLLRKLAVSRIAWLEDRKADALAGWPDDFPDLEQVRLREDWDGWEQADFRPALQAFREFMTEELSALVLPENPSPEQIKSLIKRLTDPETYRSVGRARLAHATLQASFALTAISGEAKSALKLALLSGNLGAPTEPRLRAEALALGKLGEYAKARDRWVLLLTEHPVKTHEPTDYSEAAYTAFEAAEPKQAIEILNTGIHRFPEDVDFAMRAAWIALLTGNPDRAYRFLLTGREAGYPPEVLEKATALLAISAAQIGATDEALDFYEQLTALNPAWEKPKTIEALDWPEDLKASLRQLTW